MNEPRPTTGKKEGATTAHQVPQGVGRAGRCAGPAAIPPLRGALAAPGGPRSGGEVLGGEDGEGEPR